MPKILEIFIAAISSASHVVLATHVNPDGDALGSLLGFADILKGLGKEVFSYLEEPVSPLYDFLPGTDSVQYDLDTLREFVAQAGEKNVVTVILDCGAVDRLGKAQNAILANSPVLVIDHHYGHRKFGDELWLESSWSSTGEMVYELALGLGAAVSENAAFCLYVAIVTDTGSFKYECTSQRTMRIAADLIEKGVRPDKVSELVYDNYTLSRLRLMELVLATLEVHAEGRIGLISVTEEMFEKSGAEREDTEGFINYPRSLSSVQVAGFIKDTGAGAVAVSLRAKGEVDVAAIATSFGGGGHKNAAGFRFSGKSFSQVHADVLQALHIALLSR